MSSSDRLVRLTTDNPQAEILLVDGSFKVVARGTSPLSAAVPAGIYGVKAKVGEQENEGFLAVQPGSDALENFIRSPALESPIPLSGSSTSAEAHRSKTAAAVQQASQVAPGGSSILFCVRDPVLPGLDPSRAAERTPCYRELFSRFTIESIDGNVLADFNSVTDEECASGYAARHVNVAPGAYALHYQPAIGDAVCLSLPTAPDWVLQVFVNLVVTSTGLEPDLPGVALFFDAPGPPFDPERHDVVAAETVRKALLYGKSYVTEFGELIAGKFSNPMLGLYAAHHLLSTGTRDAHLTRTVIDNSSMLLGRNFPDVVALRLEVTPLIGTELETQLQAMAGPPLLGRSWDLLLQHAARLAPEKIAKARAFSVASRLSMQGLFVSWTSTRRASSSAKAGSILSGLLETAEDAFRSARLTSARVIGRVTNTLTGPTQAERVAQQIEQIEDSAGAARALRTLSRAYDWRGFTSELRRNAEWLHSLSPLQQSLVLTLRDLSVEDDHEVIDARYVDELLRTNRVPLYVFANDLMELEVSRWMGEELARSSDDKGMTAFRSALSRFRSQK